jgi:hypothetical protein
MPFLIFAYTTTNKTLYQGNMGMEVLHVKVSKAITSRGGALRPSLFFSRDAAFFNEYTM